jgi:hypothetical protein
MQLFSLGVRGGIKKVNSANFTDENVYLIDDFKIIYLWFGRKIDKKRREWCIKKANIINQKKEKLATIQTIEQNQEYGSFLAIKDILVKGLKSKEGEDRRAELEIDYEDTLEAIEAGIPPDFEANITIATYNLSQENKTYEELCDMLAKIQLSLLKEENQITKEDIAKKSSEILKSSSTYEELCWLIAELNALRNKQAKNS